MRETAGSAAAPAARCKNLRRGSFMRSLPIVLTVPQSKCGDRKDLPLETRIQFSHLYANALKFRACGARCEVCVACGDVGEGALPSEIRLAAVTARMFDEYFTGWKPYREAHGGKPCVVDRGARRPNRAWRNIVCARRS